jgi:hypothetical protein
MAFTLTSHCARRLHARGRDISPALQGWLLARDEDSADWRLAEGQRKPAAVRVVAMPVCAWDPAPVEAADPGLHTRCTAVRFRERWRRSNGAASFAL